MVFDVSLVPLLYHRLITTMQEAPFLVDSRCVGMARPCHYLPSPTKSLRERIKPLERTMYTMCGRLLLVLLVTLLSNISWAQSLADVSEWRGLAQSDFQVNIETDPDVKISVDQVQSIVPVYYPASFAVVIQNKAVTERTWEIVIPDESTSAHRWDPPLLYRRVVTVPPGDKVRTNIVRYNEQYRPFQIRGPSIKSAWIFINTSSNENDRNFRRIVGVSASVPINTTPKPRRAARSYREKNGSSWGGSILPSLASLPDTGTVSLMG